MIFFEIIRGIKPLKAGSNTLFISNRVDLCFSIFKVFSERIHKEIIENVSNLGVM